MLGAVMASDSDTPQTSERTPPPASTPDEGTSQRGCTLSDIRNHLALLNPGQRQRLGAVLLREAAARIDSLQQEVLEQRREIAGLREERRAILDADRPQMDTRLAE
jgi:hypothetical protein